MDIRKISVGPDLKGGAMHYLVGQKVLGDTNTIHLIKEGKGGDFLIYIENEKKEVVLWKRFQGMPISIEFNIDF